jgi:hypothetical protein
MTNILPPETETFRESQTDLVTLLEQERENGCNLAAVREKAIRYSEEVRAILSPGGSDSQETSVAFFDQDFTELETAYRGWKSVRRTFKETIDMAYRDSVPRKNLFLDQIYADLNDIVGDRLSDAYTQFRGMWLRHLAAKPWDTYRHDAAEHVDSQELDDALNALVRGDELDIEDALNDLTGNLRYAFIDSIATHPGDFGDLEVGIWKRPEILIANDFWGRKTRRRLIDVLKETGSQRFSETMGTLASFYASQSQGPALSPQSIVNELKEIPADHRGTFFRCLMLHPDYEMRRYAVNNTDLNSLWKVLTPESVPCATILSLLEKLVGSNQYTTTYRKIFFDAIYRRLLSVTTRSDVLYARGILRILTKLNFFLEDGYFAKLTCLLDYLKEKEKLYNIDDITMREYIDALNREKQRVGNVDTAAPDFEGIPLVVLRKLARDGHFWDLLAMHAIVKIAKETVHHINTSDRALRIANNHRVNQEVIRTVGKRRSFFLGLSAKLALLCNPRTPPGISLEYLPDLSKKDVETLLKRGGIHPELRTMLRNQYNKRNV